MSVEYVLKPFRPEIRLNIDYPRELNEQQLAAVTAPPGPALVIAGAGSGKTRTLTYRVAFLLEQGIPPERILLLTFTNKAAGEMMRRVGELLGQELRDLWGGTFHAIGARTLRLHADILGFRRDFSILDRDDARDLIKACVTEAKIETKGTHFPKPDVLGEMFSLVTNTDQTLKQLLEGRYRHFSDFTASITRLQNDYRNRKRATNAMDFDDLLALWLKLLQEHADVCEHYQRRFQFILVDEYQDTNRLQSELIDLLAARHHNLTVVGDDAQSIYAWRGANFANILDFPQRHPGAHVFKIETNYRSTPEILQLANAVIAGNLRQFAKELAPARKSGLKPVRVNCEYSAQQSAFVAQRALELRDEGVSLNQMVVLYRSHFHALELQLDLTRQQIPFSITSGLRFFEQAHIKDVTAYLKLVANPQDEVSFKRLVQLMPGIAGKGADKLWAKFNLPTDPTLPPPETAPLATRLQGCAKSVPPKAQTAWAQFTATIAQLEAPDTRQSPARMLKLVVEAGYDDYLRANYDNHERRLEEIEELGEFARQFSHLEDFLTQLALLTNVEAEQDPNDTSERLRLSTIHQAKGLEFEVVFVIMLCEGLFPSSRSVDDPDVLEEERRLFYVSVTRAKNELYLCHPARRGGFGPDGGETFHLPSRFLKEIPEELVQEWDLR